MNKFAVIIALVAVLVGLVAISGVSGKKFKDEHFEHEGGEVERPRHHPHQVEPKVGARSHHGRVPHHQTKPKPVHYQPRHPRQHRRPYPQQQPQGQQVCRPEGEFEQGGEFEQSGEFEQGGEVEQSGEFEEQGQRRGRGTRRGPFRGAGTSVGESEQSGEFEQGGEVEQSGEFEEQGQRRGRGTRRGPFRGAGESVGESEQGGEAEEQSQRRGRNTRRGLARGVGESVGESEQGGEFEQGVESEEQGFKGGRGRRRGSFEGAAGFGGFKSQKEFDAGVRADAKQRNRNQFQKSKGVLAGEQKQFNAGVSSNDNNSVEGFHRQKNVNNDRLVVKETNRGNDDTEAFRKQSGHSQEGHLGASDGKFFGAQEQVGASSDQEGEKDFEAGVHKKSSTAGFGAGGAVKSQF